MNPQEQKLRGLALEIIDICGGPPDVLPGVVATLSAFSLPTQAADAETCLACNGRGEVETGIGMLTCDVCHGSGVTQPASKPAEGGEAVAHIENGVLVYCALPVGFTGPLYTAPPASQEQAEPAEQEAVAIDALNRIHDLIGGECFEYRQIALEALALIERGGVVRHAPVYWEWRHLDTHPDTVTSGQWSEWQRVQPRSALHTVEDAVQEFRNFITDGYKYELRALYTTPQPAPASAELPPLPEPEYVDFDEHGYIRPVAFTPDQMQAYARAALSTQAVPDERDKVDADRYRWLAAHCRSTSEHWGGRWSIIVDGPAPKTHDSEDDFDAAIDAAIAARAAAKGDV